MADLSLDIMSVLENFEDFEFDLEDLELNSIDENTETSVNEFKNNNNLNLNKPIGHKTSLNYLDDLNEEEDEEEQKQYIPIKSKSNTKNTNTNSNTK